MLKTAYCLNQIVANTKIKNLYKSNKAVQRGSRKNYCPAGNKMMSLVELPDTK
jgi:hypothetical protein